MDGKKRHVLWWICEICFIFMVCMIPLSVFAEQGVILDIGQGNVYIDGTHVTGMDAENTFVDTYLEANGYVTVIGTSQGDTANYIYIQNASNLTVVLQNVIIDHSIRKDDALPITVVASTCIFELKGINTLTAKKNYSGICFDYNSKVTIDAQNSEQALNVFGGADGAAIGNVSYGAGTVTICDAQGNTKTEFQAKTCYNAGSIIINNGAICATATGSSTTNGAAGIGGGLSRGIKEIIINGGVVRATGAGFGAGIGGGVNCTKYNGNVTIHGGVVYATSGAGDAKTGSAPAIGSCGYNDGKTAYPTTVTIDGGIVFAQSTYGAGIGTNTTFKAEDTMPKSTTEVIIEQAFVKTAGYRETGILANSICNAGKQRVYPVTIQMMPEQAGASVSVSFQQGEAHTALLDDARSAYTYLPEGRIAISVTGEVQERVYGEKMCEVSAVDENLVSWKMMDVSVSQLPVGKINLQIGNYMEDTQQILVMIYFFAEDGTCTGKTVETYQVASNICVSDISIPLAIPEDTTDAQMFVWDGSSEQTTNMIPYCDVIHVAV